MNARTCEVRLAIAETIPIQPKCKISFSHNEFLGLRIQCYFDNKHEIQIGGNGVKKNKTNTNQREWAMAM